MRYYCVRQHDIKDCGAACLATVAKQYGYIRSVAKIRQDASTDLRGTNVLGLVQAAERMGFDAKAVSGSRKAFECGFAMPAIAHVHLSNGLDHYVVIHKVTKEYILVADPARGLKKYSYDDFFAIWTGVLVLLTPAANFQRRNEKENPLLQFFRLLLPQRRLLLTVCLASLVMTFLGIASSFYFRFIMDEVVTYQEYTSLITVSIGVVFLYLCSSIMTYFRSLLMQYMSQNLDIPLMLGYYGHVLKLPMDFFETRKIGEITSRFNDASKIRAAVSGAAMTVLIDTGMAIFGGIVLAQQNLRLFLISIATIAIQTIIIYRFSPSIRSKSRDSMEDSAKMNSFLVESLHGIETIKAFNSEKMAEHKTERLFLNVLSDVFESGKLQAAESAVTGFVSNVGNIAILCVGTWDILEGRYTFGQLITFNALLRYFAGPLQRMIGLQPTIQNALVAADRLSEIMDLELEAAKEQTKNESEEEISLLQPIKIRDLTFSYGTRANVLEHVSMEIQPGDRIAVIGQSGSGKTTLAKLLLRFYEVKPGAIRIGNQNLNEISHAVLRSKMAYISQNNFLFSGTIHDNLTLGRNDIPMREVAEACKQSRADEFIMQLPGGYDTRLEENGSNLSGGQRQRLAIARALLRKPEVLIMDEATSNLDSETEKDIQTTIDELAGKITIIIIAHRLGTIRNCDEIYVMNHGHIIESGTHQSLMKEGTEYYNMWKSQMPNIRKGETL